MIENNYPNAFKEVDIILKNTEENLYKKIPKSFIEFIEYNKNDEYKVSIDCNKDIDKQKLLPKTEAILSLIYRSFFADEKEKIEFEKKDNIELKSIYKYNKILKEKNDTKINDYKESSLIVVPKENFIKKMLKKILNFKKK